jgi:hypothetical protein
LIGSGLPEDNSPTSCVLVLLMAIDVVVIIVILVLTSTSSPSRGASTPPFISKGGEVTWKVTESVTTSQSLLAYFTYIFIEIIIYVLGSTS